MNITQIEENIRKLVKSFNQDEFIFDFLTAYAFPKNTITRLKKGDRNLSKNEGEIHLKKKIFFKSTNEDLFKVLEEIKGNLKTLKQPPRFILVINSSNLLAVDTKNQDSLDCLINDLPKHFNFFLPLAGMEKKQHLNENPADVKAAERMAKLYDEIKKNNTIESEEEVHNLNVFLSRLLFCYFAEDTGIFEDSQFVNAISSHTQEDGSDLNSYLDNLFEILNIESSKRKNTPKYLNDFPYVNGGLFRNKHASPIFTRKSRQAIIEAGELDWKAIHPDIFGSMIQAVVKPDQRGGYGMHYTSVPNIMKVIEPLFLDELYESFESSKNSEKKLHDLLARIQKIKIFDPACGSGNFLIIAYKELRKLEMKIFQELKISMPVSSISLSNFYGIELDDFAHEIAILSLWLAEHQMDQVFSKTFGNTKPALPLKNAGNIVQGNATRLDWGQVCHKSKEDEIYILGNPPYLGFNERKKSHKQDMDYAMEDITKIQRLDYIGCWFVKASCYIEDINARYAFVSTNSICQGEQVSLLWPYIFSKKQEICFAYRPFKWSNNAKGNAGVTCVILGIQNLTNNQKIIFSDGHKKYVKNINPYLIESKSIVMSQRKTPLSNLPEMILGSSGIDGGNLILSKAEKESFLREDVRSKEFIKPFVGGNDFLDNVERYCIWIPDDRAEQALNIAPIQRNVEKCRQYRLTAGRDARKAAEVPHRFFYRKYKEEDAIIIPMTSSEKRYYLPVGFLTNKAIASNGVFVIYSGESYISGILSSRMHMCWTQIMSGKLESRIRYSVNLVYNTFPFPPISTEKKDKIKNNVLKILKIRESSSEKTLSQMYDPESMPEELLKAHQELDIEIEKCYRDKPFKNDEERLECLFKLYEQMTIEEKNKGTLFEQKAKPKKRKKVNA